MKFVASVLLFVALGGVGFCGQDAGSIRQEAAQQIAKERHEARVKEAKELLLEKEKLQERMNEDRQTVGGIG